MRRSKRQQRIPTSEKLADALTQAKAPSWMVDAAREGYYDDYKSSISFNITALVHDARSEGLHDIAKRAIAGEFDAQKWEADEWAKSAEGDETIQQFFGGKQSHQ